MDKEDKIKNSKERQKLSWEGMFYSMQRLDILIISISVAGIHVCLEIMKNLQEKQEELSSCSCITVFIKISISFFLVSIILNILSQKYGYKTNEQDYLMCEEEIKGGNSEEVDRYDKKSEKFSEKTEQANNISMYSMIIGLFLLFIIITLIF